MPQSPFSVAPIGDHLDQYASIAAEALRCPRNEQWTRYLDRIGHDNIRGLFDGPRLLGGLAFYRMSQWFGGRELASAGVTGVAIDPAVRAAGGCATLLKSSLGEWFREGFPIASLYASTQRLYRSVGFEQAGTQTRYSIPITSLDGGSRELPVQRYDDPPVEELQRLAQRRAATTNGNLGRTGGLWQRLLHPQDGAETITYLIGSPGHAEGYLIVKTGSRDQGLPQPLVSTDLVADSAAASRRLLTLVHDHRSMCNAFEWFGPTNDTLVLFAEEQWLSVKDTMRWMLRIVDIEAALSRRGYPASVGGTLELEIEDDRLPQNSGRWLIEIGDGAATVRRGGRGRLRMNIRELAPIFSSFYTARQLARYGWLRCDDESQLELATAAFAGDPAWMAELF